MAWAIVENDSVTRIVNTPSAVTINGVNHPKSIYTTWHADDLRDVGIFPYREDPVDGRYYNFGEVTYSIGATSVIGTREGTPKDIESIKQAFINTVKSQAAAALAQTDWMVIRQTEGGTPVPTDISAYRAAVRNTSNEKEAEISALSNINEVIAWDNQQWVETRKVATLDEDGNTVYGPETEENTVTISGLYSDWPVDPTKDEVDPAFVSRVPE